MKKNILNAGTGVPLKETPSLTLVKIQFEIDILNSQKSHLSFLPITVPLYKSFISRTLEQEILTMRPQETSEIWSTFSQIFPNSSAFSPETELKLIISVINACGELNKNPWDLDDDLDRFQKANELKTKGNEMLKNQNIKEANSMYSVGLNIVEEDTGTKFEETKLNLSNNLILGNLKVGNAKNAKELAEKLLAQNPKLVKVMYRKAVAEIALGEFEAAKSDLLKAKELDPESKEILQELNGLKEKERKMKEKAKEVYGKMFGGK